MPWLVHTINISSIDNMCTGTPLEGKVQQVVQGTAEGVVEGIRFVAFEQDRQRPPTMNASSSTQHPPGMCGTNMSQSVANTASISYQGPQHHTAALKFVAASQ
jgi:hypothetical protein